MALDPEHLPDPCSLILNTFLIHIPCSLILLTFLTRPQVMKLFRPAGAEKDRLFIVTRKHHAMILEVCQAFANSSGS